ncbi:hypothetical protein AB1Y20_014232 [Prymnesium parvum]|uniref:TIR domain-containing protein n=1 Tax=Prymnesium parvum TaxID=97485 RepID=A0AB34IFM4_PRYPA
MYRSEWEQALMRGDLQVLEYKVKTKGKYKLGQAEPFHVACGKGGVAIDEKKIKLVRWLLANEAPLSNSGVATPLHTLARYGEEYIPHSFRIGFILLCSGVAKYMHTSEGTPYGRAGRYNNDAMMGFFRAACWGILSLLEAADCLEADKMKALAYLDFGPLCFRVERILLAHGKESILRALEPLTDEQRNKVVQGIEDKFFDTWYGTHSNVICDSTSQAINNEFRFLYLGPSTSQYDLCESVFVQEKSITHSKYAAIPPPFFSPAKKIVQPHDVLPIAEGKSSFLNDPGHWAFFLSYTQRNPEAKLLAFEIYNSLRDSGEAVWLDVKMAQCDTASMKEGVLNSDAIIAVVSGGDNLQNHYLQRDACLAELRWAIDADKVIIPVVLPEDKKKVTEFVREGKEMGVDLSNCNFVEFIRSTPAFTQASISRKP